ncbi:hypothetical protein OUZ56_029910 [Daphnia magna]|uniref:Uncharacterized protein n=1 Tax=Daphnia magna TaxID=35525 RepID=A0ABR0B863_9CRUS|nr:hypothetical protein OUZ56_029910 [Daphnia magna]
MKKVEILENHCKFKKKLLQHSRAESQGYSITIIKYNVLIYSLIYHLLHVKN